MIIMETNDHNDKSIRDSDTKEKFTEADMDDLADAVVLTLARREKYVLKEHKTRAASNPNQMLVSPTIFNGFLLIGVVIFFVFCVKKGGFAVL